MAVAARPANATPLLAAAGFAGLAGLAYPFSPRLAAYALVIMGAFASFAAAIALVSGSAVSWLLVAMWGSVALLLAGLTHFTAASEEPAMASVTVAAVVALLILSGLGIAQYVTLEGAAPVRQTALLGASIGVEPLLNASASPPIAPSTSLIS